MNSPEKSQSESADTSGELQIDPPPARRKRRRKKAGGARAGEDPRGRMMEAMLASIGDQGYSTTVVADVIARAVASRKTFYEQFEDKQDCFLAMADDVASDWLRRIKAAMADTEDASEAIGAFVEELFNMALESPAELRVLAVELTAAGPPGIEHRERALEQLAMMLNQPLGSGDPDASALRARAIVGAILRLLYVRARRGERVRKPRRAEMQELAPQATEWVCSYMFEPNTEPMPPSTNGIVPLVPVGGRAPGTLSLGSRAIERRGLPRGDSNVSRSFVVHNQRERIIDALANLSATKGYGATTIPQIVQEAAVSVQAFYEHFSGKEDAFLVGYEIGHRKALAIVERAYESHEAWPTAVGSGIDALFGFLASEPAYAHVTLIDVWTASPKAASMAQAGVKSYTSLLQPGLEPGLDHHTPTQVSAEATTCALLELCFVYAANERVRELPGLTRFAADMALRPFTSVRPY